MDIVRPYYKLEYISGCNALNADVFVVGEDWGVKPHNIAVEAHLKAKGKKVVKIVYDLRTSSTQIKNTAIAQRHRDIELAVL